ncbi:MAG: RNA polymerase sigma factor [Woeseiaceae bacterium]|nr:RNA polymerase sigma factor [Woeseiaceae bacterium]
MSGDLDLVARAKLGNREAIEALFRAYQDDVYRFAYALARWDTARAQDLAQETFLTAFERLRSLRDDSSFKSWLLGIAYNLNRNQRRKTRMELDRAPYLIPIQEQRCDTEELVASSQSQDMLRTALSMIAVGQREALYLREILGCSYEETATILGITQNAAKNRVHAGKASIERAIRGARNDE